jgi:hypothetical protein
MKWGLCSHFIPLISFLGKKKLRKPNYIFNPKMVNLFQYKTKRTQCELHDKLTMKVYRSYDPTNIKIAQLLTAYWQKISINKITAKRKICKRTHANNQH